MRLTLRWALTTACFVAVATFSLLKATASVIPSPTPTELRGKWFLPVRVGQFGVACRTYGTRKLGRPIYHVSDIGMEGVPGVNVERLQLIRRIERYFGVKNLWFSYTLLADSAVPDGFIVFEASTENTQPPFVAPCTDDPLGYEVLNLAGDVYYESSEEPWPHFYCCSPVPKKPWLKP